jgi:hypothetical protein
VHAVLARPTKRRREVKDVEEEDVEEEEVTLLAVVKRESSDDEEDDDDLEQLFRPFAAGRQHSRDDDDESTETVVFPAMDPRQPSILEPGYSGNLAGSELQRSVGRTRAQLNRHVTGLGLSARFGMTLVSKRNGVVSHLSFSQTWNDLPKTTEDKLELWLGEGTGRLALARPLHPLEYVQPEEGLPIFWACKANQKGGDLCHYVGHFRSVDFIESEVVFKGKTRQALFEFKFVRYCQKMADLIAKMPVLDQASE